MVARRTKRPKKNTDAVLVVGLAFVVIVLVYVMLNAGRINAAGVSTTSTTLIEVKERVVRESVIAGSWYPKDKSELEAMLDGFLSNAEVNPVSSLHALIVPHAGYVYSGPVAAYGYKLLEGKQYDTVVILGPDHHVGFNGAWIPKVTHFETPLGLVEVSPKAGELRKKSIFTDIPDSEDKEHSVEIQLPFLQKTLKPGFKIVPIVVGNVDGKELADALKPLLDDRTLVIVSSDLSHYHSYNEANGLDAKCTKNAPEVNIEGMSGCEACGITPIKTLLYIAREYNWTGQLLDYRNSGDTAGDKSSVVGYMSVAYFEGVSDVEQEFLLKLARRTLNEYYANGSMSQAVYESELTPRLKKTQGCFVTLNKNGNLRGCIGHILPQKTLYECIIENALNAALYDSRFKPVEKNELSEIEIDVSVLTVPKKLEYSGTQDLLDKLTPMQDGVVLKYGWGGATYLPQVWEQLPDKNEFLSSLCVKSGNQADCYTKNPEISLYQAQVFKEQ
ncbi:MAG: AmmeMemoRadiSam system protein B [Candidatus Altiarchaeota archaeon]|nr:AmmeMemoRadiSam system protein B [Candidatus Altiarchaeota archaeon]